MLAVDVQGFGRLELEHLVLDFNGTLALDGDLIPGVAELVRDLSKLMQVHVVTADIHGGCRKALSGLPCSVEVLGPGPEDEGKLRFVRELGVGGCACVGNGVNDRYMLAHCAVGVVVVQDECAANLALSNADIVAGGIVPALELFKYPKRLMATLRH